MQLKRRGSQDRDAEGCPGKKRNPKAVLSLAEFRSRGKPRTLNWCQWTPYLLLQYQAQIRKKEQQFEKLQKQYQKLLKGGPQPKGKSKGMEMSAAVPKSTHWKEVQVGDNSAAQVHHARCRSRASEPF